MGRARGGCRFRGQRFRGGRRKPGCGHHASLVTGVNTWFSDFDEHFLLTTALQFKLQLSRGRGRGAGEARG